MYAFLKAALGILLSVAAWCEALAAEGRLAYISPDDTKGQSRAVKVVGPANLAHTTQVLPVDSKGQLIGKSDAAQQITQVLANLDYALAAVDASLDHAVKLNFYVAGPQITGIVQEALATKFHGKSKPAVSFVTTALSISGALIAADAVATTPVDVERQVVRRHSAELAKSKGIAHAAVLPAGRRVFVSGQAEWTKSLAEATRGTLQSLGRTLKFLKLDPTQVVQVKAFMRPMSDAAVVRQEVAKFFSGKAPPLVLVEWKSSLPIEIELIASSADDSAESNAEAVEYLTPPGMSASPVFCRVTRVNHPDSIYVSGLYADATAAGGEAQVRDIFKILTSTLKASGSDLRHLAKATYYVADDDASAMLNRLRPEFYDPKRPPAASKAMVAGVGLSDRSLTLDMIAVPAE